MGSGTEARPALGGVDPSRDDDGRGWRRAVVLFVVTLGMSVAQPTVLVALPLLVLIGLGGVRNGGAFFATVLAMFVVLAGPREALWYMERGWAILVGGVFTGFALATPHWRLSSRAIASVVGSAVVVGGAFAVRAGSWAVVDWTVSDRLRAGFATWLDALVVLRQGEAVPPSLVSAIYRTVEAQVAVFPALLALQSIAALGVVWWLYLRIVHRADIGLSGLAGFRFNDHLIWFMIAGLGMIFLRSGDAVSRAGANLAVFMTALYAVRGTAVVVFVSGGLSILGYTMFAVGLLLAAPVVIGATALIGIADTWLDLRARIASIAT